MMEFDRVGSHERTQPGSHVPMERRMRLEQFGT